MDKTSVILVILGAIITAVLTSGITVIGNLILTPQFEINYEQWDTTIQCDKLGVWEKFGNCPEESTSRVIDIEKVITKNTGLVQARNVEIDLSTYGEGIITDFECPEGTTETEVFKNHHTIEFKRFSQDIECRFDYKTVENSRIDVITLTADDYHGKQFDVQDYYDSRVIPLVFTLILLIGIVTAVSSMLIYAAYTVIRELYHLRKYKVPLKYKEFSSDFKIETPITDSDEKAKQKSFEIQNKWLDKIKQLSSSVNITEIENNNQIRHSLIIDNTKVDVDIYKSPTIQNRGTLFAAARARITTKNTKIMQKILDKGDFPCWTCSWILHNELDVGALVRKIEDSSGKRPQSTASTKVDEHTKITDATYHIIQLETGTLRTDFSQGRENGKITLIFDGQENQGFHEISKFNTLTTVLITTGEWSLEKTMKLIKHSIRFDENQNRLLQLFAKKGWLKP